MYKKNFISEEINEFKKFIIKFNIVGLALGTVIGFSLSNSTEILTNEIVMPIIEKIFKIDDFKTFTVIIFTISINIGIIIAEFIKILSILIILFICYTFINSYLKDLIIPDYSEETVLELKDVKDKNDTNIILQKKILIELQKLNNK